MAEEVGKLLQLTLGILCTDDVGELGIRAGQVGHDAALVARADSSELLQVKEDD